ncbi:MAG: BatD family protein [Paludibacter sp.]|nr:BatD family protein [Paludibacter sp.]
MAKRWLFPLLLLLSLQGIRANDVKLTASAPATVILGKPFQITYTANAKVSDFKAPAITNFDILAGPFKAESYSSQIVNGNMTSSVSIAYTFTLQAQKTGTFTIPSASVTVDKERVTSNGLSIKVLPADEQSSSTASSGSSGTNTTISASNLFIRPILSKSTVYEQEVVKLTYKLYTTYDVVQCNARTIPDFKGFLSQEMERSSNTQLDYENYNGKNYLTAVLYETLLYPQSSGEIKVDKASFDAIIRVQNRQPVRSIFDEFFDSYSNVAHSIEVPAVKVNVKSLPTGKPSGFNGVVGNFSLSSSISAEQVKVNEAVTLKISISGNGNMKLIQNPTLDFPDAFEVYDPKVNNNFKVSGGVLSGAKSVEIMFIPRHAGTFEIPSYTLSYFDLKENRYITHATPTYIVQVLKSDGTVEEAVVTGSYARKEDVKQLGNDIRYIHTGAMKLLQQPVYSIDKPIAWMIYLAPATIALLLFLIFRKQAKENANLKLVKNKRANKIARMRLKVAMRMLKEDNADRFYEELMKGLWTYLSDKLSIPVAELTKEKVSVELNQRGVADDLISNCTEVLNECEFARYAPSAGQQQRDQLYKTTVRLIGELENEIKN